MRDKPKLTDYYTPSDEKINAEYSKLIIGSLIGGYIVYNYSLLFIYPSNGNRQCRICYNHVI